MTTRLAKALAGAASVLFLISGADVATNAAGGGDLLPLSSMVRGMIFGFGAVAVATAAFFIFINKGSSSLVAIFTNCYQCSYDNSRCSIY